MLKHSLSLCIFFILLTNCAFSQIYSIKGKVSEAATGEPMPFVNVIINNDPQKGVISDIDGLFFIPKQSEPITQLTFSFTGYQKLHISITDSTELPLQVAMKQEQIKLQEVVVLPGENPAHRIIEMAIHNRKLNDPERLNAFSYKSYNKLLVTGTEPLDTAAANSGGKDSMPVSGGNITVIAGSDSADTTGNELEDFLDSQHIFIMETISKRNYIKPNLDNEKVIATKVSGLRNPTFFILATQLQPFAFYGDYISLLDKNFLNPITPGSTSKYLFIIEDTIYSGQDSVFVISYRPRKNKNFEGLKGLLYINTNRYAVQNVIAEPYEPMSTSIRIQQQYEWVQGQQWFPTQLNTDIIFQNIVLNNRKLTGVGRTYLEEIEIDPMLNWKDFNRFNVEVERGAGKKSDEYWEEERAIPLDEKEIRTYEVIDSFGREEKLDEKLYIINALSQGAIPWKFLNIPLLKIVDFNNHEGFRLGLAAYTNERLSETFSFGSYFAYGFRDKEFKYGGSIETIISRRNEIKLTLSYKKDVRESGSYELLNKQDYIFSQSLRKYLIDDMYDLREYKAEMEMRLLKSVKIKPFVAQEIAFVTNEYIFNPNENGSKVPPWREYIFSEAGVLLRYAPREKLVYTQNKVYSLGTKFPIFWLNYTRGFDNILEGEYDYQKIVGEVEKTFLLKNLGKTTISASAGITVGELPYFKQFNSFGSDDNNSFYLVDQSFNTMPINQFLADQFVTFYLSHNFGNLLYKTEKFKPQFVVATGVAFGDLGNPERHANIDFKTLNKGYYESGLIINNLLTFTYFNSTKVGMGLGVFYNYGPYNQDNWREDFAFKMSITAGSF